MNKKWSNSHWKWLNLNRKTCLKRKRHWPLNIFPFHINMEVQKFLKSSQNSIQCTVIIIILSITLGKFLYCPLILATVLFSVVLLRWVPAKFWEAFSLTQEQVVVERENSKIANIIWFQFSASSGRRVTNTPLKQRLPRVICFVNKQNESLELLSLFSLPCWLREQRLRKFNSKDFMSDERGIENEIINCSVYLGN